MDKLQKLADRLQASIDFATEHKEDFEASSWNYQEGVLLNHNEAKLVVELVKKLTISVFCERCKHTISVRQKRKPFSCVECGGKL